MKNEIIVFNILIKMIKIGFTLQLNRRVLKLACHWLVWALVHWFVCRLIIMLNSPNFCHPFAACKKLYYLVIIVTIVSLLNSFLYFKTLLYNVCVRVYVLNITLLLYKYYDYTIIMNVNIIKIILSLFYLLFCQTKMIIKYTNIPKIRLRSVVM